MSTEGSTRSSFAGQLGSHQFQRPISEITAGTISARITVASSRMPAPSPVANIFSGERALADLTGVGAIDSYITDLEEELEAWRHLYVLSAVTEIATLRGELFGPLTDG